jgi:hypothetical protein
MDTLRAALLSKRATGAIDLVNVKRVLHDNLLGLSKLTRLARAARATGNRDEREDREIAKALEDVLARCVRGLCARACGSAVVKTWE